MSDLNLPPGAHDESNLDGDTLEYSVVRELRRNQPEEAEDPTLPGGTITLGLDVGGALR
ncbi:hypothetical protein [Cryobacterium sp. BB736]|uniref:hypothetical protein n=1 Tax=Cryobacterium sp. BB736 TaxID=2746963 RepID=UPI001875D2C5|nr:hypothetical protein [Cryobacterium sp. BB736]